MARARLHTRGLFERTRLIAAALVVSLLVAPAIARAEVSDSDLAEAVAEVVQRYSQFTIFDDVNISVVNRVVTLTGRVTTPTKRDDIGKRVAKIDGIRSLTNDIKVLPLSRYDDELRVRIAQAIYNHPAFWHYTAMAVPPIHIIVENGHVTLTGIVDNQVDRNLAYALAQVPGAFVVNNDLRVNGQ